MSGSAASWTDDQASVCNRESGSTRRGRKIAVKDEAEVYKTSWEAGGGFVVGELTSRETHSCHGIRAFTTRRVTFKSVTCNKDTC